MRPQAVDDGLSWSANCHAPSAALTTSEAAFPKGHAAFLCAAKPREQEDRPGGPKGKPAALAAGSASTGLGKPKSDPKSRASSAGDWPPAAVQTEAARCLVVGSCPRGTFYSKASLQYCW